MDQAAEDAKRELLRDYAVSTADDLSRWWKKWYLKAGHKRLGRVLMEVAGKKPSALQISKVVDLSTKIPVLNSPKTDKQTPSSPFAKISLAAHLIEEAELTVIEDLESGLVKDEEGITERLIGAIHQQFRDRTYAGVKWSAMTLTAHKRDAQETWYGADILGVLQVDLEEYSVQKGFLAQAKYIRGADRLTSSEFARLKQQCAKMLSHSSASFVFFYEKSGISVVPAVAVASLEDAKRLPEIKHRGLVQFFEEHFDCFIGDQALHSPSDKTLQDLREKVAAHHVVKLSGKPAK